MEICICKLKLDWSFCDLFEEELFDSCKGIWIPKFKTFVIVESRIWENLLVESGIQLKESGISLTIAVRNPSSTDKDWNPVAGNRESVAWNPESKAVLDIIPLWDKTFSYACKLITFAHVRFT